MESEPTMVLAKALAADPPPGYDYRTAQQLIEKKWQDRIEWILAENDLVVVNLKGLIRGTSE